MALIRTLTTSTRTVRKNEGQILWFSADCITFPKLRRHGTGYKPTLETRTVCISAEYDNIEIMPCVEGDTSDCQPKASSVAQS